MKLDSRYILLMFFKTIIIRMQLIVYNEVLDWLGIQPFHFNIIVVTLLIALLISYFLKKLALFHSVEFQRERLGRCRIVYMNHRGVYQNLGAAFSKIEKDCSKHFKFCKSFGIYYDDPNRMDNKQLCRSTIGAIINEGELFKLQQFLKQNKAYQTTVLPASNCISTYYPYANTLSYVIIPVKVYPKLIEQIKKKQLNTAPAIMQIYHFVSDTNKEIQILAILENYESFYLWEDANQLRSQRIKH